MSLKKIIFATIIVFSATGFSEAYAADKFEIKFSRIYVEDNGDVPGREDGEITAYAYINDSLLFEQYFEAEDHETVTVKKEHNKKIITVPDGHNINISVRGKEEDWIGTDRCKGTLVFNRSDAGSKILPCTHGHLALNFYFTANKIN